jgi:hypothetical protein
MDAKFSSKIFKVRDHFEGSILHRKILKWISEKRVGRLWAGLNWLRTGTAIYDNEPSGSINVIFKEAEGLLASQKNRAPLR